MAAILAAVRLMRPSSTVLAFVALLVPVVTRTGDLGLGLRLSLPLLFASICTFIANDLDDQEKDALNHPERALPSRTLSPPLVSVAYFLSLAGALFATRFGVGTSRVTFLYYVLLVACISYHYVVEYLSSLKAAYVAAVSVLPVVILHAHFPLDRHLRLVALALFLFMLGREMLKDLPDRRGDPTSLLHSIPADRVATFAFISECLAVILLSLLVSALMAGAVLALMTALLLTTHWLWFRRRCPKPALQLMQLILFMGLYFLL